MLLRGFGVRYFGVSVGLVLGLFCSAGSANAQQGQIGDAAPGGGQTAQNDPELQGPALIQQASYLIGQQIFNDFARDQVEINVEALIQGIKDAAEAKPSTIPAERAQAIMMAFAKSVQAKQQQLLQQMADTNLKAGQAFLKENALKPGIKQLENGVQYEVLQTGKGASPAETDTVTVHYTGTFIDGTVFDSSVENGQPATFPLTQVIEGWTKTIPRMKVGDKWRVFIPSNLAYRETGKAPVIQPNQTLIFEIELLDVKPR
ncbi:MAG: FKBP-type peptidyl-prolyl cis-trans isomerase [Planctomycetaceae bacterium]|nr:FKBP-type peptidyl-prolyl cis-trans isomerase [Planctomycetaceae bacterium]